MRITIEPTNKLIELDGLQCRVWEGRTDAGVRCDLFIARVAVGKDERPEALAVFERELVEKPAPAATAWPYRMFTP